MSEAKKLADFVIRRRAKKEGIQLNENYWNSVLWKKKYKEQIIAANSLLRVYSYTSILSALNHKEMNWVFSLRNKVLVPYIKDAFNEEQNLIKKCESENLKIPDDTADKTSEKKEIPKYNYGKKSFLKKLD